MCALNVNVGVMGHVDSGKTSLVKLLSTLASTSAFDKNPQSKKRGITLDLGFSSFEVQSSDYPFTDTIRQSYSKVQFTLVDCPGHGSLIKTVLCGSRIIDVAMLVVDVTKGFQTQTAECLVIAEITCEKLFVVLNKLDLLELDREQVLIEKMRKRILKTLETTKFKDVPIATITAAPAGVQVGANVERSASANKSVQELTRLLAQYVTDPCEKRRKLSSEKFLFAVDHCFAVTGQGTVLTGTVLAGTICMGQAIQLPYQKMQKKIKSIQMFRRPVQSIGPGDRAGICVSQLDPAFLERGLIGDAANSDLVPCYACLIRNVRKVSYFKPSVLSKSKLHIFIGQETVIARLLFMRLTDIDASTDSPNEAFNPGGSYEYIEELKSDTSTEATAITNIFALLEFEHPVVCPSGCLIIGSKLDCESVTCCRLAMFGNVVQHFTDADYRTRMLPKLLIFRNKSRCGEIDRVVNSRCCIVRGLFKRETNWEIFIGLKAYIILRTTVYDSTEVVTQRFDGYIESSFGQSGKCRVVVNDDLPDDLVNCFMGKAGKKPSSQSFGNSLVQVTVTLEFKRHIFDPHRRIMQ